jgi:presenilin-like A22 family membrane protease
MAMPGVEVREGYELWRPNREKAETKAMKAVVTFVLLASAALLLIIALGGWKRLEGPGVGVITIIWALLYIFFAFAVFARWQRGVLPLAAALSVIMIIFAAVSAGGWFARDKPGLDNPALPADLLGLLTLLVIPVQVILIIVSLLAFNQNWHVEEERPIAGGAAPPGGGGEAVADDQPIEADADYADPEAGEGWGPPEPAAGTSA